MVEDPVAAGVQRSPSSSVRLTSWKAIAEYLGRHVTTVQRWEHEEGLPIHRHHHEKRGSVYAFPHELDAWLTARREPPPLANTPLPGPSAAMHAVAADAPPRLIATEPCAPALATSVDHDVTRRRVPYDASPRWGTPHPDPPHPDPPPDPTWYARPAWRRPWFAALLAGLALALGSVAIGRELSRAIVRELRGTLAPSPSAPDPSRDTPARDRRPANPDAWDAYQRARFFWTKRTHDGMRRAIAWYSKAIEHDASFALAYAGLADVYASLGPPNTAIAESIARGTAAAEKALSLDPSLGEPLAALGKLRAYAWDWPGAERAYRQAIDRSPRYAPGRYWFGSFLANHRRCDEALAQAREAERLDPVSMPGNLVVASIELRCGLVDEAIRRYHTMLDLDPSFGRTYEQLGRALIVQGDLARARRMLDRGTAAGNHLAIDRAMDGYLAGRDGRRHEARAIGAKLADQHRRDPIGVSAWSVAIVHAGLGDDDVAVEWLEHAYDDHEDWLEALAADERFRHLRGNGRLQPLLGLLGLPGGHAPDGTSPAGTGRSRTAIEAAARPLRPGWRHAAALGDVN